MQIEGIMKIKFKDACTCTGCFYTRTYGGYMPCQRNVKSGIKSPPKKP